MPGRPQTRPTTTSSQPRTTLFSGAGTYISAGQISDLDPNPTCNGRNWYGSPGVIGEAQKMDYDGHVRTGRETIIHPILGADWRTRPAGDDAIDFEVADWVNYNFFERNPWKHNLRNMLDYLRDGFSEHEVTDAVEKIDAERFPNSLMANRGVGVVITGFHQINAWSVDGWNQREDNPHQLESIVQYLQGGDVEDPGFVTIPADRTIRLTWEGDAGDPTGLAVQRACWSYWNTKQLLVVIEAMAHERHHLGVPVAQLEGEISDGDLILVKQTLRSMRAHEQGYAIFPNGITFKWTTVEGGLATNIAETIWRLDHAIAHTFAAGYMLLGAKSAGSYNLAETQSGQQHWTIKAHSCFVEDGLNIGQDGFSVVERCVRMGYGDTVRIPRIEARNLPTEDHTKSAPAVFNLVQAGILTPDGPLEEHYRSAFRLPPLDSNSIRIVPTGTTGSQPFGESESSESEAEEPAEEEATA